MPRLGLHCFHWQLIGLSSNLINSYLGGGGGGGTDVPFHIIPPYTVICQEYNHNVKYGLTVHIHCLFTEMFKVAIQMSNLFTLTEALFLAMQNYPGQCHTKLAIAKTLLFKKKSMLPFIFLETCGPYTVQSRQADKSFYTVNL